MMCLGGSSKGRSVKKAVLLLCIAAMVSMPVSAFELTATDLDSVFKVNGYKFGLQTVSENAAGLTELESIVLTPPDYSMHVGDFFTVRAALLPEGVKSELRWISGNQDVAEVDEQGKVTAKAPGKVRITAKSEGGVRASCMIEVAESDPTSLSTGDLSNVIVASDSKVAIASSKASVAKVTSNGIRACNLGEAVITLSAADGSFQTSYKVQVGSKGNSVAQYGLQFVGNRYSWGGSSLTNGTDCSGFVMSVYAHFGKLLPHSSYALRSVGRAVSTRNMKPGDIVCYSGHVALYIGNGNIVHASSSRPYPAGGIKVSNMYYKTIVTVRRIFD